MNQVVISSSARSARVAAAALWLLMPLLSWSAPDAGSVLQQLEARPGGQLSAPALKIPQGPTPPASGEAGPTLRVNALRIEGATLLTPEQLQAAVAGFVNRDLSLTQLQEAAWVIVQTYRQTGWLAHAFVPQQEIDNGVVTLKITEARLGQVRLEFPNAVDVPRELIHDMVTLQLEPGKPVNLNRVDRLLLLLDDLPGVVSNASYLEGQEAGTTDVLLTLGADKPLEASIMLDNYGARSTGADRVSANLSLNNLAGLGDAMQLQAVRSEGSRYGRVAYSVPVGLQGWRAGVHVADMTYDLVGSFASLQASGSSKTWGADLSVPIIRQAEHNLSGQLTLDRKRFANLALATVQATEPTTTSEYRLDVLRTGLTGNWFDTLFIAAQNTASVQVSRGNVDLTGSPNANNDSKAANTAGYFYKLNANYNREQSLDGQTTWYLQTAAQWANRNLDSSEKLYLGGAYGVRAYPSNEAGGSRGATLTTGLKHRLDQAFTLNAFVDWGRIDVYRNNHSADGTDLSPTNIQHLKGAGMSVTWRDAQGREISATWSQRVGVNPAANTSTGADSDGTRTINRLWLSAALNF
jgi:hemolysin activation/secretion protein